MSLFIFKLCLTFNGTWWIAKVQIKNAILVKSMHKYGKIKNTNSIDEQRVLKLNCECFAKRWDTYSHVTQSLVRLTPDSSIQMGLSEALVTHNICLHNLTIIYSTWLFFVSSTMKLQISQELVN